MLSQVLKKLRFYKEMPDKRQTFELAPAPNSTLDVPRLLSGLPAYGKRRTVLDDTEERKTLIVSDWRSSFIPDEFFSKVCEIITRLCDTGFQFKIIKAGKLISVSTVADILQATDVLSKREVEEFIHQQGLSLASHLVLDYFLIQQLSHELAGDASSFVYRLETREVDADKFNTILRVSQPEKIKIIICVPSHVLLPEFQHKLESLETIVLKDTFSDSEKSLSPVLDIRHLKNFRQLRYLALDLKSVKKVQLPDSSSLKRLTIIDCAALSTLTGLGQTQIKYLDIYSSSLEMLEDSPATLETLEIENCDNLKVLTGLGQTNLKSLEILRNNKLEVLEDLPKTLEELNISDCGSLRSLKGLGQTKIKKLNISPSALEVLDLPATLEELTITDCERLRSLTGLGQTKIKKLRIRNCSTLKVLEDLPATLEELTITYCERLSTLTGLGQTKIKKLRISNCSTLKVLEEFPATLEELKISDCRRLKLLRGLGQVRIKSLYIYNSALQLLEDFPTTLEELTIIHCEAVSTLTGLGQTRIEKLYIGVCPALELLDLPATLEELTINNCKMLKSLTGLGQTRIKSLYIYNSALELLEDFPATLEELEIRDCEALSSLTGLGQTKIKKLIIYACSALEVLDLPATLKQLTIIDCEALRSLKGFAQTKVINFKINGCCKLKVLPGIPDTLRKLDLDNSLKFSSIDALVQTKITELEAHRLNDLKIKWQGLVKLPLTLEKFSVTSFYGECTAWKLRSLQKILKQWCSEKADAEKPLLVDYSQKSSTIASERDVDDFINKINQALNNSLKSRHDDEKPVSAPDSDRPVSQIDIRSLLQGIDIRQFLQDISLTDFLQDMSIGEFVREHNFDIKNLLQHISFSDISALAGFNNALQSSGSHEHAKIEVIDDGSDPGNDEKICIIEEEAIAQIEAVDIPSEDEKAPAVDVKLEDEKAPAVTASPPARLEDFLSPLSIDVSQFSLFAPDFPWLAACDNAQQIIAGVCANEKKVLIYTHDRVETEIFYRLFYRQALQLEKSVFYIGSSDDFYRYLKLPQINEGSACLIDGPLKSIITTGGLLVIDWRAFTSTEIGEYKTILDKHPTLLGHESNAVVVSLFPADRKAETDLLTRARLLPWPQHIPRPEAASSTSAQRPGAVQHNVVDLYHGDGDRSWEARLLEDIRPVEAGFSATPGRLVQALDSTAAQDIILNDIPDDKNFRGFWLRTQVHGKLWANGREYSISDQVKLSTQVVNDHNNELLRIQHVDDDEKAAEFYLNSQTYPLLFKQMVIKDGSLVEKSGWLAENSEFKKRIILTSSLSQGDERCLYEVLAGGNDVIVQAPLHLLTHEHEIEKGAILIESNDIAFVVDKRVNEPDALLIYINQETSWADLIETITKDDEEKSGDLSYTRTEMPVLTALRSGRTVILQGNLSAELYYLLEPLFSQTPLLRVNGQIVDIIAKLIIVSPPLHKYKAELAQASGRFKRCCIGWDNYQTQLRDTLGDQFQANKFARIKRFYGIAETVAHGVAGTPQAPYLSFRRLKNMMVTLSDSQYTSGAEHLKRYFLQDYDPDGEAFAFLSIVADCLFRQGDDIALSNSQHDKKYPAQDPDFYWRRVNCYSHEALYQLWDKKFFRRFTDKTHVFDQSLCRVAALADTNTDEDEKDIAADENIQRLSSVLASNTCAVLKGPPGWGKTYAAGHYTEQFGGQCFWWHRENGDAVIEQWLIADTAVLVVDEANTEKDGMLSSFFGLSGDNPRIHEQVVSATHKVIFTCNPEHYVGRHYHAFLQDLPAIYFGKWDNAQLKGRILQPIQRDYDKPLTDRQLDQLIDVFHCIDDLLLPGSVSTRDLEHLLLRVLCRRKNADDSLPFNELACGACYAQWGHIFRDGATQAEFERYLRRQFNMARLPAAQLPAELREKIKNEINLCPSMEQSLAYVAEDLQINEWRQQQFAKAGEPCILGKGGTLTEGGSGLAKSTSMIVLLQALGYEHISTAQLLPAQVPADRWFIQFTLTDNANDEEWLLYAFKHGGYLIIDELNLNPTIGKLLAKLLTGNNQDGTPAREYKSYVLCTQNAAFYEGRFELSRPLKNRLHHLHRPPYDDNDLKHIIVDVLPEISDRGAKLIVAEYRRQEKVSPDNCNARIFCEGITQLKQLIDANDYRVESLLSSSDTQEETLRAIAALFEDGMESERELPAAELFVDEALPNMPAIYSVPADEKQAGTMELVDSSALPALSDPEKEITPPLPPAVESHSDDSVQCVVQESAEEESDEHNAASEESLLPPAADLLPEVSEPAGKVYGSAVVYCASGIILAGLACTYFGLTCDIQGFNYFIGSAVGCMDIALLSFGAVTALTDLVQGYKRCIEGFVQNHPQLMIMARIIWGLLLLGIAIASSVLTFSASTPISTLMIIKACTLIAVGVRGLFECSKGLSSEHGMFSCKSQAALIAGQKSQAVLIAGQTGVPQPSSTR